MGILLRLPHSPFSLIVRVYHFGLMETQGTGASLLRLTLGLGPHLERQQDEMVFKNGMIKMQEI